MKLVIEGVLQSSLPWGLVAIGVGIALLCEVLKIPSLPFAVGVYLPVSTMVPVYLGGLLRKFAEDRAQSEDQAADRHERGVLFGSGLVGGEGLMGVAIAGVAFFTGAAPQGIGYGWAGEYGQWAAALLIGGLVLLFWRLSTGRSAASDADG